MTKLLPFLYTISETIDDITAASRSQLGNSELSARFYLALSGAAAGMLVIALLGYLASGHHWGFSPINNMSAHISPIFLHNLTSFGDGIFIVSVILFIANRNIPILYTAIVAAIIGGLVSQSLKRYFNADRPPAALEEGSFYLIGKAYYSRSFPSGHTLTAFLVATVLICFSRRRVTQVFLFCLALLVGLSRVWLGVHWLIDILVGGALGILCGLLSYYVCQKSFLTAPKPVIIFTITLFSLTALSALFESNDYAYAQPLISLTAILALWVTFKNYIRPAIYERFSTRTQSQASAFLIITIIGLTLYRILVLFQPHLSLFYDEAYYYHWSLTPDLGYYSKPPFVAWLIAATTFVAGHTVVGIKLAAPIAYGAASYLVYLTGKRIATRSAGIVSALVFLSATVIGFNSVFITTDAPLVFFWVLSLYVFTIAINSNSTIHWIALGLSVGCGMLSKYTMAALPLSLFVFLLCSTQHRPLLLSYKPWLAAILAGALFSLNLWWNSQHNWIAFAHTSEISQQGKNGLNLPGFFEFLAGQIFVIGPVWFWLAVHLVIKRKTNVASCSSNFSWVPMMLLFATLGILILISLQAITSRAFINWAAPWVVGCSLLIGIYSSNVNIGRYLRTGLIAHLLLLSAFYHWPQLLSQLQIEPSRKNNPYQRLAGWDGVAKQLKPILEHYPDAILASDSRDLLAYIGFHALPRTAEFARWNPKANHVRDHYDLNYNLREYTNSDKGFIFVSKSPLEPKHLSRFDTAYSLGSIIENVYKDKQHQIYVYQLKGFNGYE